MTYGFWHALLLVYVGMALGIVVHWLWSAPDECDEDPLTDEDKRAFGAHLPPHLRGTE